MEKQTLMAVGLALVVLVVWQVVVLGPQEQARRASMLAARDSLLAAETRAPAMQESPRVSEAGAPSGGPGAPGGEAAGADGAPGAATAAGAAGQAGALAPIESGLPDAPVTIETDLFRAVLSTRGARIGSLSLLKFPSHRGGVVDLVPEDGPGAFGLTLRTTSGNLVLDDFVFAVDYTSLPLTRGGAGAVTFSGEPLPGLHVTKRYAMRAGSYDWTMEIDVRSDAGAPAVSAYTLDLGAGLALTEKDATEDHGFLAGALREDAGIRRKNLSGMKKGEELAWNGKIRWAAITNKYFIVGLAPQGAPPLEVAMRPAAGARSIGLDLTVPLIAGATAGRAISIFAGPQDFRLLEASPLHMGEAIEFGWRLVQPISQFLLWLMQAIYQLIPNYGVAIVLVSTAAKVAFYPLSHQGIKSMREMQKIQGELQALRDRHKGDPQRLNKETMALYKKNKVNPMGGCLPMLLQMPVFIALYNVLRRTIELRQAPFGLWIQDLASPDVVFTLPFTLPFVGNGVCVLPILMGISTYFQQKMTAVDPKQKMLLWMMPIVMTLAFFRFPAGLVLYWLTNTLLTIAQQYLIERKERSAPVAQAA